MSGTARFQYGTWRHQGLKKLLVGVGYKAQAKGAVLNLALGFSHPVNYEIP